MTARAGSPPSDDDARAWYERNLPGGLGRDWLRDYTGTTSEPFASLAAFLWACEALTEQQRRRDPWWRGRCRLIAEVANFTAFNLPGDVQLNAHQVEQVLIAADAVRRGATSRMATTRDEDDPANGVVGPGYSPSEPQ